MTVTCLIPLRPLLSSLVSSRLGLRSRRLGKIYQNMETHVKRSKVGKSSSFYAVTTTSSSFLCPGTQTSRGFVGTPDDEEADRKLETERKAALLTLCNRIAPIKY